MSNAAINVHVQVFVWTCVLFLLSEYFRLQYCLLQLLNPVVEAQKQQQTIWPCSDKLFTKLSRGPDFGPLAIVC